MDISNKKFDIIAYDFISTRKGGGEIVLDKTLNLYPNAKLAILFETDSNYPNREIIYSFLQYFPKCIRKRPKVLLPFIPLAVQNLTKKLPKDQRVLAISNAYIKNLDHSNLIVYINSPARMLWSDFPELFDKYLVNNKLLMPLLPLLARYFSKLRDWDFLGSQNKKIIANSKNIALRVKKYYRKDVDYVYPIEKQYYKNLISKQELTPISSKITELTSSKFFLSIGSLARSKRIDTLIDIFKANSKFKLLIAGEGPERKYLERQARGYDNIYFLGRVSEVDKIYLYRKAQAFLFPGIEDFGLTILDSALLNCPIVALDAGGAREILGNNDYLVHEFDGATILPILKELIRSSRSNSQQFNNDSNLGKILARSLFK